MTLTAKQRQYLRGLAHDLEPVLRVGRAGVSDAVIKEGHVTFAAHELAKVRIDADEPSARREMAATLAAATGAAVAGVVGKMAILYKPRAEKPVIKLP